MYSFFVLGQVPGTGLVITFTMWAELAALLFTLLVWIGYRRRREFRTYNIPTISAEPGSLQTATAQ